MKERGYVVGNLDATLIAQKPKLSPHKVLVVMDNFCIFFWGTECSCTCSVCMLDNNTSSTVHDKKVSGLTFFLL